MAPPRPRWGSQRSPDLIAVFNGPTSNGREGGMGKGREGERKWKGMVGEERGGKGEESEDERGREGGEGDGIMHPLGFSKVGAYDEK